MKNNVISVLLYGKEICKIQWQGGYKQGFGKVGTIISFNPDYHTYVKGKVDFPQIGFEKGTTERGVSKVSKSC